MKRAKLVPLVTFRREKLSIIQIAEQIICFYKKLSLIDTKYSQLNIISEGKFLNQSFDVNTGNAIRQLAEVILLKNKKEIRKMDKEENPNFDFVMDESIISIGLEVRNKNASLMTLHFSFLDSKNLKSGISNIITNPSCFDSLKKAKFFLESVKESFSVDYSVIKISDRDINKVARGYKAPLGWITYFSNDYEISIPDDLKGIEYEYTSEGKYLILTREMPINDESFDVNKEKLMNLMEEIKTRTPEYSV